MSEVAINQDVPEIELTLDCGHFETILTISGITRLPQSVVQAIHELRYKQHLPRIDYREEDTIITLRAPNGEHVLGVNGLLRACGVDQPNHDCAVVEDEEYVRLFVEPGDTQDLLHPLATGEPAHAA